MAGARLPTPNARLQRRRLLKPFSHATLPTSAHIVSGSPPQALELKAQTKTAITRRPQAAPWLLTLALACAPFHAPFGKHAPYHEVHHQAAAVVRHAHGRWLHVVVVKVPVPLVLRAHALTVPHALKQVG